MNLPAIWSLTRGPQGQPSPLRTPHGRPRFQNIIRTSHGQSPHGWPLVYLFMATGLPVPCGCYCCPLLLSAPCAPVASPHLPSPYSHTLAPPVSPLPGPCPMSPHPAPFPSLCDSTPPGCQQPFGAGPKDVLLFTSRTGCLSVPTLSARPRVRVHIPPGPPQPFSLGPKDRFERYYWLLPLPRRVAPRASPFSRVTVRALASPGFFAPASRLLPLSTCPGRSLPRAQPAGRCFACPSPPSPPLCVCIRFRSFLFRVCPTPVCLLGVPLLSFDLPPSLHARTTQQLFCFCGTSLVSVLQPPSPPRGRSRGVPRPCQVGAPPLLHPLFCLLHSAPCPSPRRAPIAVLPAYCSSLASCRRAALLAKAVSVWPTRAAPPPPYPLPDRRTLTATAGTPAGGSPRRPSQPLSPPTAP